MREGGKVRREGGGCPWHSVQEVKDRMNGDITNGGVRQQHENAVLSAQALNTALTGKC